MNILTQHIFGRRISLRRMRSISPVSIILLGILLFTAWNPYGKNGKSTLSQLHAQEIKLQSPNIQNSNEVVFRHERFTVRRTIEVNANTRELTYMIELNENQALPADTRANAPITLELGMPPFQAFNHLDTQVTHTSFLPLSNLDYANNTANDNKDNKANKAGNLRHTNDPNLSNNSNLSSSSSSSSSNGSTETTTAIGESQKSPSNVYRQTKWHYTFAFPTEENITEENSPEQHTLLLEAWRIHALWGEKGEEEIFSIILGKQILTWEAIHTRYPVWMAKIFAKIRQSPLLFSGIFMILLTGAITWAILRIHRIRFLKRQSFLTQFKQRYHATKCADLYYQREKKHYFRAVLRCFTETKQALGEQFTHTSSTKNYLQRIEAKLTDFLSKQTEDPSTPQTKDSPATKRILSSEIYPHYENGLTWIQTHLLS